MNQLLEESKFKLHKKGNSQNLKLEIIALHSSSQKHWKNSLHGLLYFIWNHDGFVNTLTVKAQPSNPKTSSI